jgi:DNA-3-methyladenine glycosylase I
MSDPLYIDYHDREWGFPVVDDVRLFEKICLEGFQSGLSWLTILRKRENFRQAFAGFNMDKVARFTRRDTSRLLKDTGIVRHRGKIESTINNARRALDLLEEFGSLAAYVWGFEPRLLRKQQGPRTLSWAAVAGNPTTPQSIAMSKDLKKRGWSFVGPTTVHAFMQAMGLVNHHISGCHAREAAERARQRLRRPTRPPDSS